MKAGILLRLWTVDYLIRERGYDFAQAVRIADSTPGDRVLPTTVGELLGIIALAESRARMETTA